MALLHAERWQELAPEFEARRLLQEAEAVLADAPDHATVARTLKGIRDLYRLQHPSTQDPKACEEYEQRKAGTFDPGAGGERKLAPSAAKQIAQLQQESKDQAKQIHELQQQLAAKQKPEKTEKDPK